MNKKKLIKVADKVREALIKLQEKRWLELLSYLSTFSSQLQEMSSNVKKLGVSLKHCWLAAAKECGSSIGMSLNDLQYRIQRAKELIEAPDTEPPTLSFLVEELKQLQQEFDGVDYDKAENALSAVTEPIILEDVYLGPFKIELKIDKLSDLYKGIAPYCCIALAPHSAATNEDVTHPHVSSDRLCEGDGYASIRAALEEGRLCDFFTLVRSILSTYSPDSPYVRLDEWDGQVCYECSYVTDGENSYFCDFCDNTFCEECSTCCLSCDRTVCLSCSTRCPHCEEHVCPNCIKECPECGFLCCNDCLEDDLCPKCKEELEKENEQPKRKTKRTKKSASSNKPETSNSEIKLAS